LDEALKECWRALSIFPADFALEAMGAVWKKGNSKEIRSELVKRHLLIFDPKNKRSRLHDLARDYAYGKLSKDEIRQIRTEHAVHYGRVLARLERVTIENLALLDLESHNIQAGFSWVRGKVAVSASFAEICADYVGYASDVLFWRLPLDVLLSWQKTGLLAYARLGNKKGQSLCYNNLGRVASLKGQYKEAISFFKKALDIASSLGYRRFEAAWLGNLANAYSRLGKPDQAIKYLEKSVEISKAIRDRHAEGWSLGNLGTVYQELKNYDKAIGYYLAALQTFDPNDTYGYGVVSGNLASAYFENGEKEKSKKMAKNALPLLDALHSPNVEALKELMTELEKG
jgi:tetratricopeptide (TPR) repeat protein